MTPRAEGRIRDAVEQLVEAISLAVQESKPKQAELPDRLLSVEKAARALDPSRSATYALVASGELRSLKVGARRLVPSSAISEFVNRAADD